MAYVVEAILQCIFVLVLAGIGWLAGRRLGALRWWWVGLLPGLFYVALLILFRLVPSFQRSLPLSWIMAGRMSRFLGAVIIPVLILPPVPRLRTQGQRRMVKLCAAVLVGYCSVLPFLGAAFAYPAQSRLKTMVDTNGICLQSNGYNCGPAAAVTILRGRGIPATESELAVAAHTTCFTGTPMDLLCVAVRELYGVQGRIFLQPSLEEMEDKAPFIAVVKHAPMVDHYVVVLDITDSGVLVGDPLKGMYSLPHASFEERWRAKSIVFY